MEHWYAKIATECTKFSGLFFASIQTTDIAQAEVFLHDGQNIFSLKKYFGHQHHASYYNFNGKSCVHFFDNNNNQKLDLHNQLSTDHNLLTKFCRCLQQIWSWNLFYQIVLKVLQNHKISDPKFWFLAVINEIDKAKKNEFINCVSLRIYMLYIAVCISSEFQDCQKIYPNNDIKSKSI